MVHNIVTALGLAFFLFGLFVFFTAVLGLFHFDYVLNRMHAAAVGDALGIFCILIGLILFHGWSLSAAKTLPTFMFWDWISIVPFQTEAFLTCSGRVSKSVSSGCSRLTGSCFGISA